MAQPFDSQQDLNSRMLGSLKESTAFPGEPAMGVTNPDGSPLSVTLSGSDIEIGAVEIKNATTDDRATVNTDGRLFVTSGTLAADLGKAEDAVHVSGDTGIMALAVRNDAGGSLAGANGDYIPLTTDSSGNLRVLASGSAVTQYAEDTAHVTGDLGFECLSKRTDSAASSAGADGDYATVNTDNLGHVWTREGYAPVAEDNTNGVFATADKPLSTSTYSWTTFINLGANNTLNVKASAGNVFSIYCHNLNASDRFIQIHNTAGTPAGAAVPALTYIVPAQGVVFIDGSSLGMNGLNFTTGIAFAFSTTETTFTAAVAGDQVTTIHYK